MKTCTEKRRQLNQFRSSDSRVQKFQRETEREKGGKERKKIKEIIQQNFPDLRYFLNQKGHECPDEPT